MALVLNTADIFPCESMEIIPPCAPKLVSLFTVITVFTIINLSSLQADEQGSFEDWLIYIENLALKEGISKETINIKNGSTVIIRNTML